METRDDLKPDVIASWLTPPRAVAMLGDEGKDNYVWKRALLTRLASGAAIAAALESSWEGRNLHTGITAIPPNHWARYDASENPDHVWKTGDITFDLGREHGTHGNMRKVHYFGVLLEPTCIEAFAATTAASKPEEAPDKGPPVSDGNLGAWYTLYKTIYPDKSEDHAWRSAHGMFHDKSVSRSKIRKLRGERELGRPKKDP
jgi:hypothetical protein